MKDKYIKRRDSIIITSLDLLSEAGIQGLTTKEIAKRQGITEGAIYKHFESKKEIILAILDRYCLYDKSIEDTIKEQHLSSEEGLLFAVKAYAEYYENYPQAATITFSYDVFKYDNDANEKMVSILKNRTRFITELIYNGQLNGEFRGDIDPEEYADMFLGAIWVFMYKKITYGLDFDLKERVLKATTSLISVLKQTKKP